MLHFHEGGGGGARNHQSWVTFAPMRYASDGSPMEADVKGPAGLAGQGGSLCAARVSDE